MNLGPFSAQADGLTTERAHWLALELHFLLIVFRILCKSTSLSKTRNNYIYSTMAMPAVTQSSSADDQDVVTSLSFQESVSACEVWTN